MGWEGEREKDQCVVASHVPPAGGLAGNLGMCPHWEWKRQPFGSQVSTQSTEPHPPGYYEHSYTCLLVHPSAEVLKSF